MNPSASPHDSDEPRSGQRLAAAFAYYIPSVLVMLGLVALWQIAVDIGGVKEYILPSPWAAMKTTVAAELPVDRVTS